MKGSKWWLLAGLPLALAACGANDTDAEEDDPTDGAAAADTAASAVVLGTPPGPGDEAVSMAMILAPMAAVGGSGVTGEARLAGQGSQTQVAVRLAGLQPNSAHSGHVHQGTCDALGPPVAPLQDLTADASGAGSATSTVAIPGNVAMDGQHIVAYHQGAGESAGPPIVCGAIARLAR